MIYRAYHAGKSNITHIPLHGGIAIQNIKKSRQIVKAGYGVNFGTLACIVSDKSNHNRKYLLTNKHVLYEDVPDAAIGDVVAHPAFIVARGLNLTEQPRAVARIYNAVEGSVILNNGKKAYIDGCIAEPSPGMTVTHEIPGIGIPKGVAEPKVGMRVKTLGAINGLQSGMITATGVNTFVQGAIGTSKYYRMDTFDIIRTNLRVGPGDSGSIVVNDAGYVVGLMYAAHLTSSLTKEQLANALLIKGEGVLCRASVVADVFNIDFKGEPGVFMPTGQKIAQSPTRAPVTTAQPLPRPNAIPTITAPSIPSADTPTQIIKGISNNTLLLGLGGVILLVAVLK